MPALIKIHHAVEHENNTHVVFVDINWSDDPENPNIQEMVPYGMVPGDNAPLAKFIRGYLDGGQIEIRQLPPPPVLTNPVNNGGPIVTRASNST